MSILCNVDLQIFPENERRKQNQTSKYTKWSYMISNKHGSIAFPENFSEIYKSKILYIIYQINIRWTKVYFKLDDQNTDQNHSRCVDKLYTEKQKSNNKLSETKIYYTN